MTAEIAAALPALVLAVLAAVWVVAIGVAQLRCADAAREAARAAARHEQPAIVSRLAESAAPDGARVSVDVRSGAVTVEVAVDVAPPLPFAEKIPAPTVRARATALQERW